QQRLEDRPDEPERRLLVADADAVQAQRIEQVLVLTQPREVIADVQPRRGRRADDGRMHPPVEVAIALPWDTAQPASSIFSSSAIRDWSAANAEASPFLRLFTGEKRASV